MPHLLTILSVIQNFKQPFSTSVAGSRTAASGAGVHPSSTLTGASLRSSAPSRPTPTHGVCNTRSRSSQQQQQLQQQQTRHPTSLSAAVATLRASDEQLGTRSSTQDLCDNSNDSGLGFEERQQQHLNKAAVSMQHYHLLFCLLIRVDLIVSYPFRSRWLMAQEV